MGRISYFLGIDLGTTYTAAAVWRSGRAETANLGTRAPVVPSVVLLRDDGEFLVGEAAERRSASEPQRVAREFKRRVGDPTPIILAGTPCSADALTAKLLRWTVDKAAESEGAPAAGVAVTHPANWGDYKKDLLGQAIRQADLDDAAMLSEPEAAAIHYASQERVPAGSVVAVYDLGGGTFDAAVLRRTDGGWEILGEPEGIERLGGIDFDEAVFHHVAGSLGDAIEQLDPDDATAMAAVSRLRQECIAAKEALASDTDASVPVMLPTTQTEVRMTRGELEELIRPALGESVAALHRALRSADITADEVHAVLLVGGSSRIPLVSQLVGSEMGRPVAVDAHPKHGVALGAAIVAAQAAGAAAAGGAVGGDAAPTVPGAMAVGAAGAAAGAAAAGLHGRGPGDTANATPAEPIAATGRHGAEDVPPGYTGESPTEPLAATGRHGAEDLPPGYTGESPTEPLGAAPWAPGGPGAPTEVMPPPPPYGDDIPPSDEHVEEPKKRPVALIAAIAAIALLAIAGGIAFALTSGNDGDPATPPPTVATTEPPATQPPTTPPATQPPPTEPPATQPPPTEPPTTQPPTTEPPTTATTDPPDPTENDSPPDGENP